MDFRKFTASFAPLAAPLASIGLIALLAACHGDISINGEKGKKLADLDLSGPPPHGLVLLGPDTVKITTGDKLAITVVGDSVAAEALRFTLKDGTLGILRKDGNWSGKDALVVNVTMPAPSELTMSGSGQINAPALAGTARVLIAGSGDIDTPSIAADKLDVNIAGSGNYRASGKTAKLALSIAGSGSAELAGVSADQAEINIAGSGDATLASDGTVKANMIGSGSVHVKGRAKCEVSAVGSGKLVCEP